MQTRPIAQADQLFAEAGLGVHNLFAEAGLGVHNLFAEAGLGRVPMS
ncbi:MAG: hypothetical protein L0J19_11300 [Brevibacterium sp.]|nr:hypothetical protein [Brevibacterium sp.]MDN6189366.1 hypothetical protein [Brevibacterium sp.]